MYEKNKNIYVGLIDIYQPFFILVKFKIFFKDINKVIKISIL